MSKSRGGELPYCKAKIEGRSREISTVGEMRELDSIPQLSKLKLMSAECLDYVGGFVDIGIASSTLMPGGM